MGSPWNIMFMDIRPEVLTPDAYMHTVGRLRRRLEGASEYALPLLPVQRSGGANSWFEIRLYLDNGNRIRLRFKRENLYLTGYQINEEEWREFGVDGRNIHVIDSNSRLLGFSSNYNHLFNVASAEEGYRPRLGNQALIHAANSLVRSAGSMEIARALVVIICMFSEATRFIPIQNYVQRTFYRPEIIPSWVGSLVLRWGRLSEYALYHAAFPNAPWVTQTLTIEVLKKIEGRDPVEGRDPIEYEPTDVKVRTVWELLKYVGILQNNPDKKKPSTNDEL